MWVFLEECHKKCQVTSREVDTRKIFIQTFQMKMCTSAHTTEKSIHKTTSAQWKKGHANITKENFTRNKNISCIFPTWFMNYGTKLFTTFKDKIHERETDRICQSSTDYDNWPTERHPQHRITPATQRGSCQF